MKNNEYIRVIAMKYNLNENEIADIVDYLSYIARDMGEDDTALVTISEELTE